MSLLGPDHMLVGRSVVERKEAKCIHCKDPFKYGVNLFNREGLAEIGISGICERCFDELFADCDDEDAATGGSAS